VTITDATPAFQFAGTCGATDLGGPGGEDGVAPGGAALMKETEVSFELTKMSVTMDSQGNGERLEQLRAYCRRRRLRFFAVSAITREGLDPLIQFVGKKVGALRAHA